MDWSHKWTDKTDSGQQYPASYPNEDKEAIQPSMVVKLFGKGQKSPSTEESKNNSTQQMPSFSL